MKRFIVLFAILSAGSLPICAQIRNFVVMTSANEVNHWPAADGFVGTPDDVVDGGLSEFAHSSPNSDGSLSYIITNLGFSNEHDPRLPARDTITFVRGSASINPLDSGSTTVPLLTSLTFSGTELFPGHGAYSVRLTNPHPGGSMTRKGNSYSFAVHFDFEGTYVAGPARATNALASGLVYLVEQRDFDAPAFPGVGDDFTDYIKAVAIPLARSQGASALLCSEMNLQTAGSIPGTTGFFPPLNAYAVLVAAEFAPNLRLTSVVRTQTGGVRLQWSPIANAKYSVEAANAVGGPYSQISTGLATTEYTDSSLSQVLNRFYRIRSLP